MPPLGCGIGMYYQPNKEFCLLLLPSKVDPRSRLPGEQKYRRSQRQGPQPRGSRSNAKAHSLAGQGVPQPQDPHVQVEHFAELGQTVHKNVTSISPLFPYAALF